MNFFLVDPVERVAVETRKIKGPRRNWTGPLIAAAAFDSRDEAQAVALTLPARCRKNFLILDRDQLAALINPPPSLRHRMREAAVKRFGDQIGCSDGACAFGQFDGMHTNGGCSCTREPRDVAWRHAMLWQDAIERETATVKEDEIAGALRAAIGDKYGVVPLSMLTQAAVDTINNLRAAACLVAIEIGDPDRVLSPEQVVARVRALRERADRRGTVALEPSTVDAA